MAEYNGVMVCCEIAGGRLTAVTTELLGCGRKLADDLGQELLAVLAGSGVGTLAQEAIAFGADKVYVIDDPLLKDYHSENYLTVIEKAARQAMPSIILLGQTSLGRDMAPRLAFRLETAAVMDCIDLAIDTESKKLLQTKPVYGGNAHAIFTSDSLPQIAAVRARTMPPPEQDTSRRGELVPITADLDPSVIRTRLLEKVTAERDGIGLEDARVVITGGRGIGGNYGFRQLEELAKLLNGAVGASRPPCDNGWVAVTLQIGLTGRVITPDLYIAVAVSGTSQHMSGCSGARNIVAINKDPQANIFREARFGVVGDWEKVLPAFVSKVRELLDG